MLLWDATLATERRRGGLRRRTTHATGLYMCPHTKKTKTVKAAAEAARKVEDDYKVSERAGLCVFFCVSFLSFFSGAACLRPPATSP
jgi:hypothetical protein